jgi:hypothetical protein
MTNTTTAYEGTSTQEAFSYTWLEDYLERLEGKEAFRAFQDRYGSMPEYYALVASLAA